MTLHNAYKILSDYGWIVPSTHFMGPKILLNEVNDIPGIVTVPIEDMKACDFAGISEEEFEKIRLACENRQ